MSLTNEQIKQIIDGAPDGATHIHDDCYYEYGMIVDTYRLSDLAEILALRELVTELEIEFGKLQRAADRAGLRMIKAGLVSEFEKLDSVLCSYPLKLPKESANERD
jgi:hypothetical protein